MENVKRPRPILVMLAGPPGTGKSTEVKKWLKAIPDAVVLSTDALIERVARFYKKDYGEIFHKVIKRANKRFTRMLRKAVAENSSVIWDQTNLTQADRCVKMYNFSNHYKILVSYACKKDPARIALLEHRNNTRERGPLDWNKIVFSMLKKYEEPTPEELTRWDEHYEL